MSDLSSQPSPGLPRSPRATGGPAILLLDDKGVVLATNKHASSLWNCLAEELLGRRFVSLFAFEVVSEDPDLLEAQWEVLCETATEQRVPLSIQLDEEHPRVDIRVEIEAASGGEAAWLARVSQAEKASSASSTTSPPSSNGTADDTDSIWSQLAHSGAAGFFDLNFASSETYYSPAWKQMLGYEEADLANNYDTWLKLIHPEDSGAAPDQVGRRQGTTQRSFTVEFRMKHRRGHWVWVHCVGVQHFATDGELDRVVGLHLDISEQKETEEQGIEASDRMSRLAEEGGLAVFDLDFIKGKASVSAAWREVVGDPVEYPDVGKFTTYLKDSAGDVTGYLANFGDTDATWSTAPAILRRLDHREVDVMLGLHRQVSRRGELLRVVGIALPLPDSLLASNSTPPFATGFDTAALDLLNEGIILTDRGGHVQVINRKAQSLLGTNPGLAMEHPLAEVFELLNPVSQQPADDALETALASQDTQRLYTEHLLKVADAPPRPVVWAISQLWDGNRAVSGIVLVFRDPAEMGLTPEELIRANRFDSLGQLAGGIAHDFNNLLSTILGGISLAKDNRDYGKLDHAETAAMAAKTLTRQLLSFARGTPGGTFVVAKPIDILTDAVRVAAAGSPVKVTMEVDEATTPLVEVDRGQLIQVFQNLIINALQAMPDPALGLVTLRARGIVLEEGQLPPLPGGSYAQIEVADNGSGIPPEKLDRIFEPFFTTKKSGTGLGLATVVSIVRKHGGQLGVDSTIGVGTTFTAFLPATQKALESTVRRPAALRFGTGRVLFMDDEPQLCTITQAMLESLDYKVDIARHGEEALALYRKYHAVNRPYDIVLLDLTIVGGMGGEETFKRLKEIDPEVRAIVSSGYDNDDMAREFIEAGFCGYLTKPYRVGELGKMLKSVLGG